VKDTILVIGATGNQGRSVIRALSKFPNFAIRGLVRQPSSEAAKRLAQAGVELVQGDMDDRKSLENAMKGVYGVFSYQNMNDGVQKEEERGKRVAHAAKFAEVPHFIYSSVGGADRNTDVSYFLSKWRIETFIKELDLPNYTIFRPVAFMDNFAMDHRDLILSFFRSSLKGKPVQMIAVADIGKWVARAFSEHDPYQFQEIEIAGDELTYPQIEAAFVKVEGKKPSTVPMPGAVLAHLGDMGKLYTWMFQEGYQADLEFCRSTIKDMLTFEQWLALKHRGAL
jgi:uncharacterized protein YbjT (DUF2867 family)